MTDEAGTSGGPPQDDKKLEHINIKVVAQVTIYLNFSMKSKVYWGVGRSRWIRSVL
jgi:hypothetical protein